MPPSTHGRRTDTRNHRYHRRQRDFVVSVEVATTSVPALAMSSPEAEPGRPGRRGRLSQPLPSPWIRRCCADRRPGHGHVRPGSSQNPAAETAQPPAPPASHCWPAWPPRRRRRADRRVHHDQRRADAVKMSSPSPPGNPGRSSSWRRSRCAGVTGDGHVRERQDRARVRPDPAAGTATPPSG